MGGRGDPDDGSSLHVEVLGAPRAHTADGTAVPVRGRIQATLLAMLATAEDRAVTTSALVDGLWGDHPPRDPRHALQAQVSRLRKALPAADLLTSTTTGYGLDRPAVAVDARRFLHLADRGRTAIDGGDHAAGAGWLREALGLWRGPAFDGIGDAPGLAPATAHLEAVRLRTLDLRIEADLLLGETEGLIAELRSLVSRHPTRERLWRALMTALARDAQQAEALAVYRTARDALAEVAGVEPGPLLDAAQAALLQRRPVLPRPSAPPRPQAVVPCAPPPSRLRRLATGPFVGRQRDRQGLERLWATGTEALQVALMAGDAGIGKTRLLAEVARRLGARGAPVRYARCEPAEAVPLQPVTELLREDLDATPAADHADRLGRAPGELSRLVPDLAVHGQPVTGSREVQRAHLLDAISSWLARASRDTPLLVVVDDLQWADSATLATLRHVVRSPGPARGLLVLAHRSAGMAPGSLVADFLDDLARDQRQVRRLRLEGLAPRPTAELLAAELPGEATVDLPSMEAVAPRLHQLTGGNPFRTIELARRVGDVLVTRQGLRHEARTIADAVVHEVAAALTTSRARVRAV